MKRDVRLAEEKGLWTMNPRRAPASATAQSPQVQVQMQAPGQTQGQVVNVPIEALPPPGAAMSEVHV